MHFIILGHTSNLISCVSIITYFRMITLQGTIFWTTSSNKELAHRWLPYLATTSLGETHARAVLLGCCSTSRQDVRLLGRGDRLLGWGDQLLDS